jgi:hypothetical protein
MAKEYSSEEKAKYKKAVFGIFKQHSQVENCVERLREEKFRNSDISVLMPDIHAGTANLGLESKSKAPEGSVLGGGVGLAAGGILGWLAGIGAIAIPGAGPFIAAGPIVGMLAGLGTGAAVGALAGGLIGMGIPEYEAKRYEGVMMNGGTLLSVHVDDPNWRDKAKRILQETGAEEIATAGEESPPPPDKAAPIQPSPFTGE